MRKTTSSDRERERRLGYKNKQEENRRESKSNRCE